MNNKITTEINVKDNLIGVIRINNKDCISLNDLTDEIFVNYIGESTKAKLGF